MKIPILITTPTPEIAPEVAAFLSASGQPVVHLVAPRQFYHPEPEKNRCINIAKGRTAAAKVALESFDADRFLFLDDDILPPADAIANLASRNAPVVAGWFQTRGGAGWVGGRYVKPHVFALFAGPMPGLTPTHLVSLGCTMVMREILTNHTFDAGIDRFVHMAGGQLCHLADSGAFSLHVMSLGMPLFLDGDVVCKHLSVGKPVKYEIDEPTN